MPGRRKTKIVATLGPATDSDEAIGKLIEAGVSVFRLNMSHGEHGWVRKVAGIVRSQCKILRKPCALLMDLQGPADSHRVLENHSIFRGANRTRF